MASHFGKDQVENENADDPTLQDQPATAIALADGEDVDRARNYGGGLTDEKKRMQNKLRSLRRLKESTLAKRR